MKYPILMVFFSLIFTTACQKTGSFAAGDLVPKTVDEDPNLPSIFINGTQLHAESFGDPSNPLIVVLHGGPGGDYRSLRAYKALAKDAYHVVFYDQRSAGLSARQDARNINLDTYLADLDAVIEYYKSTPTEKVILFGHSWGAMQATMYINAYPNKVRGAILDEPGALSKTQLNAYLSNFIQINILKEEMSNIVWSGQILSAEDHIRMDYQAVMMLKNSIGSDGSSKSNPMPFWRLGGATFALANSSGEFDWTTNLQNYSASVLFIHSDQNPAYSNDWANQLAASFPTVTQVQLKGVGHDSHYQKFDEYIQLVRNYLQTL